MGGQVEGEGNNSIDLGLLSINGYDAYDPTTMEITKAHESGLKHLDFRAQLSYQELLNRGSDTNAEAYARLTWARFFLTESGIVFENPTLEVFSVFGSIARIKIESLHSESEFHMQAF